MSAKEEATLPWSMAVTAEAARASIEVAVVELMAMGALATNYDAIADTPTKVVAAPSTTTESEFGNAIDRRGLGEI